MDDIDAAIQLQQKNMPIINLTANSDEATFNRAKQLPLGIGMRAQLMQSIKTL